MGLRSGKSNNRKLKEQIPGVLQTGGRISMTFAVKAERNRNTPPARENGITKMSLRKT